VVATIISQMVGTPVFSDRTEFSATVSWSSRMRENLQVRLCDQEMQVCTVGDRPTEVKVRSLVAWIAGRREIEFPKPIDKTIFRMVSKSSGRNESERRCGLESEKPQGLSLQPEGESSMDRRRLTDAAVFTLAG
jgi:hypothetical protein